MHRSAVTVVKSRVAIPGIPAREFPPGNSREIPENSLPVSREIFAWISREIREIFLRFI